MILQAPQVGRDAFIEQIGAGRERLAELGEGWAHLLQGRRQPLAGPARVAAPGKQPRPGDQRWRDAQRLEREQRVVTGEAQRHAQQAPTVAKGTQHLDAPAAVQRHDAQRHVAPGDVRESGRAHARGQLSLRRKATDALV